jgi:hypothetical protein
MPPCALRFGPADGSNYFPYNLGTRVPQFGYPGNAKDVSAVCRRVLGRAMSLCSK